VSPRAIESQRDLGSIFSRRQLVLRPVARKRIVKIINRNNADKTFDYSLSWSNNTTLHLASRRDLAHQQETNMATAAIGRAVRLAILVGAAVALSGATVLAGQGSFCGNGLSRVAGRQ
jgi:hypothetical protein